MPESIQLIAEIAPLLWWWQLSQQFLLQDLSFLEFAFLVLAC
jgi:hypothetical protein